MVIIESMRADVIGLNCSTGPEHMRQPVRFLCENSRLPISVIPNAGIPLNQGGDGRLPADAGRAGGRARGVRHEVGVSIVGGCCGTTPDHLRAVVERVWGRAPLRRDVPRVPRVASAMTRTTCSRTRRRH
jgi:5-methyltetrahydrofolate--homocysteine methyltransferase